MTADDIGHPGAGPVATVDQPAVKVLLCEDNRGDYVLIKQKLQTVTSRAFEIDWARTVDECGAALRRRAHDVALLDYRLIGGSGLDVLRDAISIEWPGPVIMLTSARDPSIDLLAAKIGACDFLSKDEIHPETLERAIRYGIANKRMETIAADTNRELLQHIVKLRDAKREIELQNRRIISLAYHLAASDHGSTLTGKPNSAERAARTARDPGALGLWNFDRDGRTILANDVVLSLLEVPGVDDLASRDMRSLISELSNPHFWESLSGLSANAAVTVEVELIGQRSGRHNWVVMSALAALDDAGKGVYLTTVVDVTSRRNQERTTQFLARHDGLTGVANRAWFDESLHQAAAIAQRNRSLVGLLCVDLDDFKSINDNFGHQVGDQILRGVASRLSRLIRESDMVARLGGDEFSVMVTNLAQDGDARIVAAKIEQCLAEPYEIGGRKLLCPGSVGVAVFPTETSDLDELLERADAAMYRSKKSRAPDLVATRAS